MTTIEAINTNPTPVISTYGTETSVRESPICRLSFYIKCCAVGCGLDPEINEQLIDYNSMENYRGELHRIVFELASKDLQPEKLINLAFFIDDAHEFLPYSASNSFVAIESTAIAPLLGQYRLLSSCVKQVRKVMICTSAWLEDFYFNPVRQICEIASQPNSTLTGPHPSVTLHCSHCRGIGDYCTCESDCPFLPRGSQCHVIHRRVSCNACSHETNCIHGAHYRCLTCESIECVNLCEPCFESGAHDHTHEFERINRPGSIPIPIPPRVEAEDPNDDALVAGHSRTELDHLPSAEATLVTECKAYDHTREYDSRQSFRPGQVVRLVGLSTAHMNGKRATVIGVTPNEVHIQILRRGESEIYSVAIENLMICHSGSNQEQSTSSPILLR